MSNSGHYDEAIENGQNQTSLSTKEGPRLNSFHSKHKENPKLKLSIAKRRTEQNL